MSRLALRLLRASESSGGKVGWWWPDSAQLVCVSKADKLLKSSNKGLKRRIYWGYCRWDWSENMAIVVISIDAKKSTTTYFTPLNTIFTVFVVFVTYKILYQTIDWKNCLCYIKGKLLQTQKSNAKILNNSDRDQEHRYALFVGNSVTAHAGINNGLPM